MARSVDTMIGKPLRHPMPAGLLGLPLAAVALPICAHLAFNAFVPAGRLWANVPLHAAIEATGGLIAVFLAGFLVLRARCERWAHPHVWVAAGLTAMGLLDTCHAMTPPGQTFVWFHSLATLLGGLLFAGIWLPARLATLPGARHAVWLAGATAVTLCLLGVVHPHWVPAMVVDSRFTPAARTLNGIGGAAFLLAALGFSRGLLRSRERGDLLFATLCALFGTAGVLFGESSLWDANWWLWHVIRLFAYFVALAYLAIQLDRAQRETHAATETLSAVVAAAPVAVVVTDGKARVRLWNPEAERLFGIAQREAEGRAATDLGLPDVAVPPARPGSGYEVGRRQDGSTFPLRRFVASVSGLTSGGAGHVSVLVDVSSQAALEDQLRQAQKMEAVGRLTAGIAHDFNNLLTAIVAGAELLQQDTVKSAAEVHELADEIALAAQRAALLTKQLLAFSSMQLRQPEVVDLDQVVADTVPMLRRIIGEAVAIQVASTPDGRDVEADPHQLQQVLVNLALLVTDVVLTDGHGTDLAATVRTRDPGCKVILMSGYAGPSAEVQQALGEGVRFLAKPFGPAELTQEVARLLVREPKP